VTLLTDFGLVDPYVGTMKGVLHREAPDLRAIVDLCHEVPPQDVATAALFLEAAFPYFPVGTVHLAVVDPEVGTERPFVVLEARGHALLAPDNGLLSALAERERDAVLLRVDPARLPAIGASATFHGRDRFAPLAARLVGGTPPSSLGAPWAGPRRLAEPEVAPLPGGGLRASIVWIDRFGNGITSARREHLAAPEGGRLACRVAGREVPFGRTYADVAPGELVCVLDSYDRFEIAERDGDAARTLGLERGTEVQFVRTEG
jgi:S-adenosylmethionine hydrolase